MQSPIYSNTADASSVEQYLQYAAEFVRRHPESLPIWARRLAQFVYGGALDFHKAWYGLWLAAVGAGIAQLEAQEQIGRSFSDARKALS